MERFRERKARAIGETIADALETVIEPLVEELSHAEPELPDELSDRGWDIWEPLLAIADAAGGEWPERARAAAVRLSSAQEPEDDTLGIRLIADCRDAFEDEDDDRISSKRLLPHTCARSRRRRGVAGTTVTGSRPRELAHKLRPYGIESRDLRTAEGTRKGYRRADFEDAWARYCPYPRTPSATSATTALNKPETALSTSATGGVPASRIERGHKPHGSADIADLADSEVGYRATDPLFDDIDPDPMAPAPLHEGAGL